MTPYELRPDSTEIYNPISFAEVLYRRLEENIEDAKANLRADEQLAVFYPTASGEMILVESFGYHNPYLIIIYGVDHQMNSCRILAHAYSFQIVMRFLKIQDQNQNQRRPIGFIGDVAKKSKPESDQEPED